MKKYRDPLLWFLSGMAAMILVSRMFPTSVNYHNGYDAAMKEAYELGLAERLDHSEFGTIYSWLPRK
jgi:hypothetical protein